MAIAFLRKLFGCQAAAPPVPEPQVGLGDMNAPWDEWPNISPFSVEWRMGFGEGYLEDWTERYAALSAEERAAYRSRHPQPELWGVDEFYRSNEQFAESGDKTWRQRQQEAP